MAEDSNSFDQKNGLNLRHYIDQLNEDQCRKCSLCRADLEKQFITGTQATVLARDTVDREFRAITKSTDLARESVEHQLTELDKRIAAISDVQGRYVTKEDFEVKHDTLAKAINTIKISDATLSGKASQKTVNIAMVFSILTALCAIISLVLVLK